MLTNQCCEEKEELHPGKALPKASLAIVIVIVVILIVIVIVIVIVIRIVISIVVGIVLIVDVGGPQGSNSKRAP